MLSGFDRLSQSDRCKEFITALNGLKFVHDEVTEHTLSFVTIPLSNRPIDTSRAQKHHFHF